MSSPKIPNAVTVSGCASPLGLRLLLFQLKLGRRKARVSWNAGLGNSFNDYLLLQIYFIFFHTNPLLFSNRGALGQEKLPREELLIT